MVTLAVDRDGKEGPAFEYDLAGTPCAGVIEKRVCSYVSGIQALFPQDRALVRRVFTNRFQLSAQIGGGSSQTILLARRGRTTRMCSLDPRREGQLGYPLLKRNEQA